MKLIADWKRILKKAWSIRMMLAAGAFSGAEAVLPFFAEDFPRGLFAALTLCAVAGGVVTRLLAQREFEQ